MHTVFETNFEDLKLIKRGKVRDIYDLGNALLMVASDRISAFDVIMPDPVPEKGKILTQISLFWFDIMASILPNHVISSNVDEFPTSCKPYAKKRRRYRSNVLSEDIYPDPAGLITRHPDVFAE